MADELLQAIGHVLHDVAGVAAAELRAELAERDALIRWLAMAYSSDPIFRYEGEEMYVPGTDGRPSAHKMMLQRVWEEVVGTKGDGGSGYWALCQHCGSHVLVRPDLPIDVDNQEVTG